MPPADPPSADGLVLRPFRAVRYNAGVVGDISRVVSPPYDVIDEADRDALERRDPHNVVRLILPRDEQGRDGDAAYAHAARLWRDWQASGVLAADEAPAIYVYEQASANHVQRGLLGAVGLRPSEAGVILPHENTMAGPVADRLALMEATEANLEPIILVHDGGPVTRSAVAEVDIKPPLADFTTADGWRHRLWPIADPTLLDAIAAELQPRRAVIADGHHRYATYLRYQADRDAPRPGKQPWDYGLALLVDAGTFGPQVHAIHRVVLGISLDEAVGMASTAFRVTPLNVGEDPEATLADSADTAFVVTDGHLAYLLDQPDAARQSVALPADRSQAWRALDVAVAHELLVKAVWGLPDTEDVVGYRHDAASAVEAARADGGVALLLRATPVTAVTAVAAAGERMPRKSTLFTPKPASGLVMRDLRLG